MTGQTLEQIRKAARKTRSEAAQALGISVSAYWRKEGGMRPLRLEEARKLAELFGVSVETVVNSARKFADTASA